MKTFAALALAAALGAGTMSTASAFGIYPTDPVAAEETLNVGSDGIVHDDCHGRMSGTAHWLCGTETGGPTGGLF